MLGVSFQELMLVSVVALLVLGPNKLPGVLRSLGRGIRKLRKLTTEVRSQSGIDDVLRAEGLEGGINELRSLVRNSTTGFAGAAARITGSGRAASRTPAKKPFQPDLSREYPVEGPDANGALPEDLLASSESAESELAEGERVASDTRPPSSSTTGAVGVASHTSAAPETSAASSRPPIPRPKSGAPRASTIPPPPAAPHVQRPKAPKDSENDS